MVLTRSARKAKRSSSPAPAASAEPADEGTDTVDVRMVGAAPGGGVRVYHVIVLYVLAVTVVPTVWHARVHGAYSMLQGGLAFFVGLNALICYWEIALAYRTRRVGRDARRLRAKTADSQEARFGAIGAFFFAPCGPRDCGSLTFWSRVWSTYAVYDPSYADHTTFGYWIDVGNGHSTLGPSLLWLVGMTRDLMPARAFGLVGLLAFYQEFYGTAIYFCTFFYNRRYVGKTALEVALFVGLSNGIWFLGPLVGMWASLRCVYDDSYAVFRP